MLSWKEIWYNTSLWLSPSSLFYTKKIALLDFVYIIDVLMFKHNDFQSRYWKVYMESSDAEKDVNTTLLVKNVPITLYIQFIHLVIFFKGFIEGVQVQKIYNAMVISLSGMSNI